MTTAFPFHDDCYRWPRVAVFTDDGGAELNVHCLYHPTQKRFSLVGFIGVDREEQIGQVINLAEMVGAEVKLINGVRFHRRDYRRADGSPADDRRLPRRVVLLHPG